MISVVHGDFQFPRARSDILEGGFSAGPTDPDTRWRLRRGENLHRAVLGPIAAAGANFADRPRFLAKKQADRRADSVRIRFASLEAHPHTWLRACISKEFGCGSVLGDDQIGAAVAIEVSHRAATLFAVDFRAAFLARHRGEIPSALAA